MITSKVLTITKFVDWLVEEVLSSGLNCEEARGVLMLFLENVTPDAATEHAKRKTVTDFDVACALKRQGLLTDSLAVNKPLQSLVRLLQLLLSAAFSSSASFSLAKTKVYFRCVWVAASAALLLALCLSENTNEKSP